MPVEEYQTDPQGLEAAIAFHQEHVRWHESVVKNLKALRKPSEPAPIKSHDLVDIRGPHPAPRRGRVLNIRPIKLGDLIRVELWSERVGRFAKGNPGVYHPKFITLMSPEDQKIFEAEIAEAKRTAYNNS